MTGTARFLARRASGHRSVLLTATSTALVAAVLLVSATVMAPGVAESALRRTLTGADADETALTASTGLDDAWPSLDAGVRAAAESRPGVTGEITATMSSTAFAAPGLEPDDRLAVGWIQDLEQQARLVEGRWAHAGAAVPEATVNAAALDRLGVSVGDTVTIEPLTGSAQPVDVVVTGSYEPTDPGDPAWSGNAAGVRAGSDARLTIVGPVLLDRDDLLQRLAPATASADWRLPLDIEGVDLADTGRVADELDALTTELRDLRAGEMGQEMSVTGSTRDLVAQAREAASSARALLLVVVAMLTVLGVWALAFTARLVASRRATVSALLRARGAGEGRMLRWSLLGTLLPALAIAAAAPPLAELALEAVRERGSLGEVANSSALAAAGWLVAAALAALWLLLMVTADLRAGRCVAGVVAEQARPRRAALQRAGLDLLVLALGLLALQQLRRPADVSSELVLVAAPSLIVLAGTVVVIRALPWVCAAAADAARSRPGVAGVLGATEAARRPVRHVAASVLVILAITVSVFAATTQSSWTRFSASTVDLAEPADVRLQAAFDDPREARAGEREIAGLPGVEAMVPVVRRDYTDGDVSIAVVGIGSAGEQQVTEQVARWDPRLAGGDPAARLAALTSPGAGPLPVVVTSGLADQLGLAAGDESALPLSGTRVEVRVTAVVDAVPGVPDASAMLVNGSALSARLDIDAPDEWWLSTTDDGRTAAAAAREIPGVTEVTTHAQASARAADDPSAAGLVAGLTAGLAFAAVFVLIGVVVHAVTSFQARTAEHAVVRAMGLGRRGLTGAVTVEQAVLLGFSTLAGLGLGLLVAWLVVPHTVGGLAGLPEVPPLRMEVPWDVVGGLVAAVAILAALLVGLQTTLARRIDVAAVLRAGEDT